MEKKGSLDRAVLLYGLAAVYVLVMYGVIPISGLPRLLMGQRPENPAIGEAAYFLLSLISSYSPLIIAALSFILLLKGKGFTRAQLLNCALLVKYALIPLYLAHGAKIALFIWTPFVPSLFAIIGSFMILSGVFSILFTLLGTTAFSIPYLVRAKSDGVYNKYLILAVLQYVSQKGLAGNGF